MQVVGHSDGVSNQLGYVRRQGHPLRTVTIHCSASQLYTPHVWLYMMYRQQHDQ